MFWNKSRFISKHFLLTDLLSAKITLVKKENEFSGATQKLYLSLILVCSPQLYYYIVRTNRSCARIKRRSINHGCSGQLVIGHRIDRSRSKARRCVASAVDLVIRESASRLGGSSRRRLAADRRAFITGDPICVRTSNVCLSVTELARRSARAQFARISRTNRRFSGYHTGCCENPGIRTFCRPSSFNGNTVAKWRTMGKSQLEIKIGSKLIFATLCTLREKWLRNFNFSCAQQINSRETVNRTPVTHSDRPSQRRET